MYQVAISNSSSVSTASSRLHPRVKQALTYLDCHLEDELVRYRRAKAGYPVAPSSVSVVRSGDRVQRPLELTKFVAIDALSQKQGAQPEIDRVDVPETIASGNSELGLDTPLVTDVLAGLSVIPRDSDRDNDFASEQGYSLDDLMNPEMDMVGQNYAPDDYLESSEELLRSLAQEEANVEYERSSIEGLLTPFGIGAMMLMLMGSGMFGYLVMNPLTLANLGSKLTQMVSGSRGNSTAPVATTATDSTNSGGDSGGEVPKESSEFMDLSLNSLVVMGTQGKGIAALKVPKPIAPKSPTASSAMTNGQAAVMPTVIVPGQIPSQAPVFVPGQAPGQPNNTAASGSAVIGRNVPQQEKPAPAAAKPRPSLYRPVQQPRRIYQAPSRSSSSPQPLRTVPLELPPAPSSTPTSIPPVQESVPLPSTSGYRVEIPYTGDTALEKAQQYDSGAYFKNGENGAVIQMGETFANREAAEAKAQQLKQQGFEGVEVQK